MSAGTHAVEAVRRLVLDGYLKESVHLARRLLDLGLPGHTTMETRCLLAELLIASGDVEAGIVETELVAAGPAVTADQSSRAAALRLYGLQACEPARAWELANALAPDGVIDPGRPETVMAATVRSDAAWARGDVAAGLRLGRSAVAAVPDTTPLVWPRLALAPKLADVGEHAEAEEMVADAQYQVEAASLTIHRAAALAVRARVLLSAGNVTEAGETASSAARAAERMGTPAVLPVALVVLARVDATAGELTMASRHVRRYREALARTGGWTQEPQYAWTEAFVTAARDGAAAAAKLLTGRCTHLLHQPALMLQEPAAAAWLVGIALAVGDRRLADAAVDLAERVAHANPDYPTVVAAARHARSRRAGDTLGLASVALQHRSAWARELAVADLVAGIVSLQSARCDSCVAGPDRPHPTSSLLSLTAAEREVARLVGQGLTNRQVATRLFLSPHTVKYHLRSIFRKLGVRSRSEVVRLVSQLGDTFTVAGSA